MLPADSALANTEFSLDGYPNTVVRDEDGAILYSVESGNTIIEIALLYGLTLDEIYGLNGLNGSSLLSVGQEVIVGYVPEPTGDLVGGSADLPAVPETETPTPAPTATATLAAPVVPTLPPPSPTAAVISALPTAEPEPTPEPELQPVSQAVEQTESGLEIEQIYLIFLILSIVILLTSVGLLLVYLGRRNKIQD